MNFHATVHLGVKTSCGWVVYLSNTVLGVFECVYSINLRVHIVEVSGIFEPVEHGVGTVLR